MEPKRGGRNGGVAGGRIPASDGWLPSYAVIRIDSWYYKMAGRGRQMRTSGAVCDFVCLSVPSPLARLVWEKERESALGRENGGRDWRTGAPVPCLRKAHIPSAHFHQIRASPIKMRTGISLSPALVVRSWSASRLSSGDRRSRN